MKCYRLHADLHNGQIGISAWYTAETFKAYRAEVESYGYTVIKVECSTVDNLRDFSY